MAGKDRGKKAGRGDGTTRPVQPPDGDPPLSRDRVVAMAITLLDEGGLEGLTMRRLADRLGSGVMSLYWHVDNKEDVLDLALDRVLEFTGPEAGPGAQAWRDEVLQMLEDWRASMLCHPWSAALLPRRALGPAILGRLERLGQTLSGAGVADADLNVAIWALWNYVMGATISRANFELTAEDMAAAQTRLAERGAAFPTIERSRLLMDEDWAGAFRKGLAVLLDGLAPRR